MGKYYFKARVLTNTDGKHFQEQVGDLTKIKKYVIILKKSKIFRAYALLILTKLKKFAKIYIENNEGDFYLCIILIILKKCFVAV